MAEATSKDIQNLGKSIKASFGGLEKVLKGNKAKETEDKLTFKDVISQIKAATSVGSKPKREDFIDAAKELNEINGALSQIGADPNNTFPSNLIGKLGDAVQLGLDFIAEQKPSLKGAAAKGIASKMKETSAGFIKNLAMETVS